MGAPQYSGQVFKHLRAQFVQRCTEHFLRMGDSSRTFAEWQNSWIDDKVRQLPTLCAGADMIFVDRDSLAAIWRSSAVLKAHVDDQRIAITPYVDPARPSHPHAFLHGQRVPTIGIIGVEQRRHGHAVLLFGTDAANIGQRRRTRRKA